MGMYDEIIQNIGTYVGGKENITYCAHCMTRLRFNVKDQSKVELEKIQGLKGVLGSQWSNGQLQVVIGPSVSKVYEALCDHLGLEKQKSIDEVIDEDKSKKKFGFGSIIDGISGCLTPLISLLIGAGLLKVIVIIGTTFGLLAAESPTAVALSFASDAGFYFLPIFIGATAAKKFGANIGLGMLIGAIMIHPTFVANVGASTAMSVFGLPIYAGSYTSTIFPSIMAVYVMSHVERFFSKHSPDFLRTILVPFATIIVMFPLTMCLIAPIGSVLGVYLANAIMWLYNTTGFVGVAVFAAVYPLMVITGMHGATVPPMFQSFAQFGYEPIITIGGILSNINQGAATAAVACRTKDKDLRSAAASSAFTAIIGGVTEPALFGINLKLKKPLYCAMAGNFVAGGLAGLLHVKSIGFSGSSGIFAIVTKDPIALMALCIVVGIVVTFVLTLIAYKPEDELN